jgi:Domain of Unknown Function (DUF1259)
VSPFSQHRWLTVTLDGVTIKPALALGGWIAFKPAHGGVMAMGDLVLLETEVTPVVTKLTEGGLVITAIHNNPTGIDTRRRAAS